eukprot:301115-Hanusia_phi.AAC.4
MALSDWPTVATANVAGPRARGPSLAELRNLTLVTTGRPRLSGLRGQSWQYRPGQILVLESRG